MLKYAIVNNEQTKSCDVGMGDDANYYQSVGMRLQEVEQAYDGNWYLAGYAPAKPLEKLAAEKRAERDAAIEKVIWRVQRYDQQKFLQILTTDSEETYQNLLLYIQSLRDISKEPDFPNVDILSFEEWFAQN